MQKTHSISISRLFHLSLLIGSAIAIEHVYKIEVSLSS